MLNDPFELVRKRVFFPDSRLQLVDFPELTVELGNVVVVLKLKRQLRKPFPRVCNWRAKHDNHFKDRVITIMIKRKAKDVQLAWNNVMFYVHRHKNFASIGLYEKYIFYDLLPKEQNRWPIESSLLSRWKRHGCKLDYIAWTNWKYTYFMYLRKLVCGIKCEYNE